MCQDCGGPDDRNPEPKPFSSPYWNDVAAGRKPDPLPPPTFGDRAFLIFLVICLISGFMYLTRDRGSDIDLESYVPAYQRAMGLTETPQNVPESPQSDFTPRPAVLPSPTPAIASGDTTEAQDILDEIESNGMPDCGEPLSIAGADDIEPANC